MLVITRGYIPSFILAPLLKAQGGSAAMAGTTVWCRLSAVNGQWHAKEVGPYTSSLGGDVYIDEQDGSSPF